MKKPLLSLLLLSVYSIASADLPINLDNITDNQKAALTYIDNQSNQVRFLPSKGSNNISIQQAWEKILKSDINQDVKGEIDAPGDVPSANFESLKDFINAYRITGLSLDVTDQYSDNKKTMNIFQLAKLVSEFNLNKPCDYSDKSLSCYKNEIYAEKSKETFKLAQSFAAKQRDVFAEKISKGLYEDKDKTDANIFLGSINNDMNGNKFTSKPLLKPDGKTYYAFGAIEALERNILTVRANRSTGYFFIKLSKKEHNSAIERLAVGNSIIVLGEYIDNKDYTTIANKRMSAPVFSSVKLYAKDKKI